MFSSLIRVVFAGAMLALGVGACPAAPVHEAASARIAADALTALRQGGYVVVLVHGPVAADDADTADTKSHGCAAQPSLTDTGRLMASGIGKLLGREGVRIDEVMSSPTCRAMETAERIARHANVPGVRGLDALIETIAQTPVAEKTLRAAALRRLASTPPPVSINTLVVTHRANVADAFATDRAAIRDGEMFVLHPWRDAAGHSSCRLVYRVKVEDLSAYVKAVQR